NLQFIDYFYFWDLSKSALANTSIPNALKFLHCLVSIAHYFVVVLPFNLLLLAYTAASLARKETSIIPNGSLLRTLAIGGIAVLVSSAAIGFLFAPGADVSHMRRVQFISYVMWLLFAAKILSISAGADKLRKLSVCVCIAALCSLAYTVVYSSRPLTSTPP